MVTIKHRAHNTMVNIYLKGAVLSINCSYTHRELPHRFKLCCLSPPEVFVDFLKDNGFQSIPNDGSCFSHNFGDGLVGQLEEVGQRGLAVT